jgi:hypothetical protein
VVKIIAVYFTIYTYLHQLFAMLSGRLQHLPEFKFPASTTHRLPPLKYKPRCQFFSGSHASLQQNGPHILQLFWSILNDF